MNYIKTQLLAEEYTNYVQFGDKYILYLFPHSTGDYIDCIECMIDNVPTEEEIEQIKQDYTVKFIEEYKQSVIETIDMYDKSSAVNECYYNDTPLWLSLEERKNARISIDAYLSLNIDTVTYFLNNIPFEFNTALFDNMLKALEVYAQQCYVVTATHKLNIMNMESIEEILNYDITAGYPEKLHFQ